MKFTILGLSNATKFALAIVTLFLVLVAGLAVNYGLTEHLISHSAIQQKTEIAQSKADEDAAIRAAIAYSDGQWCGALILLTSHPTPEPADPASNPFHEGEYLFYEALLSLEKKFGCKS